MTVRKADKPVVVITGASSGIGLAAARLFHDKGFTVYGLNRHIPQESFGINYLPADITQPQTVIDAVSRIWQDEHRIDILINNAGFGISGAAEFTAMDEAVRQFEVNLFGAFTCIKAVLPFMREQESGIVVNVSSVAGVIPIPFQAFYSASKAALNCLTLALANEDRPHKIRFCAVMPGDVRTGFTAAREKLIKGSMVYPAMARSVAVMEKDEQNGMSPEYVAKVIYNITNKRNPKPLYTAGLQYKIFVLLSRILPVRLVNYIVGKIYN